ncbi:MAG: outer membrane protein assembly factor BamD [Gammaproteobacteria bacterium]|nr:outer membrane protein assembly factor BamD [Gammaproteobacteria bacterium]NNF62162.1 outer membrane protein assembly factor BamD [Gammaproteobacteria bacterium]NNM21853.1 outer membrane protein assembly factor BamD [Gammaproteobacteria bacterium]
MALSLLALLLAACGGKDATLDEEGRSRRNDATLYETAKKQIDVGGYDRAVTLLEQLEIYFPFSEYTRRGQLDLIYAYYKVGNIESAIDAANEFIRENPTYPDIDYAYYLRGLIYFDRDANAIEKLFGVDLAQRPPADAERSLSYFSELVRRFPESDYAPDARQRMVHLRERLARFEVYVANYYADRRAWVAAARRARNVVEDFQDTSVVTEALQIMARSYRELGMDDLAEDAERVLRENQVATSSGKKKRGLFRRNKEVKPERPAS